MYYAKDGNFVSNQHDKKMDLLDTPLTDGASYIPHSQLVDEYLRRVQEVTALQAEVSSRVACLMRPHLMNLRPQRAVTSRQSGIATLASVALDV
jgi:hypothetical protein